MSHFSSISRMKFDQELGAVRLSVRTSEAHVDEFLIPSPDAVSFCAADSEEGGWFGEGCLRGKRSPNQGILSIEIGFNKRTLFSMQRSGFDVMVAQLRSLLREAQNEGVRLVPSQLDHIRLSADSPIVDYEKLASKVVALLMPVLQSLELKAISVPLPTSSTPEPETALPAIESTGVFIPSDIDSDLEGQVKVKTKDTKGRMDEAAQKLKEARRKMK
jgi:hypothetical protein